MKLLLTSAGIKNSSIHNELVQMLGKPIAECSALVISTASYVLPNGFIMAWQFLNGLEPETPMVELGWKSVGVLELTALPSMGEARWVPLVQQTDVLLVSGGDPFYLHYWMRQSGLADLLPSLDQLVYVGLSAGSLVMTSRVWEDIIFWTPRWMPPTDSVDMLGIVDFAIFPHLDYPGLPVHTMAHAEKWGAQMSVPAYAIDDETAIKVVDGTVEVISEGNWKFFAP